LYKGFYISFFRLAGSLANGTQRSRLGEELEFQNRQSKPKLNNVPMLMLLLPAKFLQFSLN